MCIPFRLLLSENKVCTTYKRENDDNEKIPRKNFHYFLKLFLFWPFPECHTWPKPENKTRPVFMLSPPLPHQKTEETCTQKMMTIFYSIKPKTHTHKIKQMTRTLHFTWEFVLKMWNAITTYLLLLFGFLMHFNKRFWSFLFLK